MHASWVEPRAEGGGLMDMTAAALAGTLPAEAVSDVPPMMVNAACRVPPRVARKITSRTDAVALVVVEISARPSGRCDALQGGGGPAAIVLLQEREGTYVLHGVETAALYTVASAAGVDADPAQPQRRSRAATATPIKSPAKRPLRGRKHDLAVWAASYAEEVLRAKAVEKPIGEGGLGIPVEAFRAGGVYTEVGTPMARNVSELEESIAEAQREFSVLSVRAAARQASRALAEAGGEAEAGAEASYVPLSETGGRGVVSPASSLPVSKGT
jgi:hypothetical protein